MAATSALSQILLPIDPTAALHAATKQYVDAQVQAAQNAVNVVPLTYITTASSAATTAAIVFTNVTATWTPARIGAKYRVYVEGIWVSDVVSTTGFWMYWKHNGAPGTGDTQTRRHLQRSHADAGGVDALKLSSGEIVATALTPITCTLGLNLPDINGSDPGPVRMHAVTSTGTNAATFGSAVWVDRIGY